MHVISYFSNVQLFHNCPQQVMSRHTNEVSIHSISCSHSITSFKQVARFITFIFKSLNLTYRVVRTGVLFKSLFSRTRCCPLNTVFSLIFKDILSSSSSLFTHSLLVIYPTYLWEKERREVRIGF